MATALDALNALQRLEQGEALDKLYDAICEVSEAVLISRSRNPGTKVHKGKVTLTLEIIHERGWDELQTVILGQIKKDTPKSEPQGATFYTFNGSLWRDNPRADPLPSFREVPQPETAERTIDPPVATSREIAQ